MNREEAHKHKKRKSGKTMLFAGLFIAVCVSVLIAFLFALGGADFAGIFGNRNYWLTIGVVNGMLLVAFLLMYRIDAQNVALNENDLEDTEWLTTKKLKKLKEFTVTTWEKMPEHNDEIVIGAEKKGKGLEIISTSALHALIVGTTGSGKTTGFVDQNIAILGRSKGKPSMIIADPKKELYEKHAKQLESEGYKISTLDLREPYSSARWNPMQVLIRRIRQVRELQNDMKEKDGKYYACGEVFISHVDARTRVQELKDEIFENAMDLVYTLCPVQNKDQPTWEEGARNLIFGLVLAFCEDCIAGKMDEKQLQLFNVYHNITKYCSEDTTALKKYLLEGREEFSKVRGLVNTVLITSDKTLTSYLSEVNSYMQQLADDGILSMTSENDIDIANMDESPNALFVIVPDERFTRHRFVTLFLTQTYTKRDMRTAELYLQKFVSGRYSDIWNAPSTLKTDADLIDFDFQSLFANKNNTVANAQMLLIFRFIEQEVINAREKNKGGANLHTLIIADEAHLYIDPKFPIALDFFYSMSKRIRKYNGSFIPATQNIADWNANEDVRGKTSAIIKNSQYSFIFKLSAPDMKDVLDIYKAGDSFNDEEQRMIISAVTGQTFFVGSTELRNCILVKAGDYTQSLFEEQKEEETD